MFNFILQYSDSNTKPHFTMVQVQSDTLTNAQTKANAMLGNGYTFVKCQGVSEIIVPEEDTTEEDTTEEVIPEEVIPEEVTPNA